MAELLILHLFEECTVGLGKWMLRKALFGREAWLGEEGYSRSVGRLEEYLPTDSLPRVPWTGRLFWRESADANVSSTSLASLTFHVSFVRRGCLWAGASVDGQRSQIPPGSIGVKGSIQAKHFRRRSAAQFQGSQGKKVFTAGPRGLWCFLQRLLPPNTETLPVGRPVRSLPSSLPNWDLSSRLQIVTRKWGVPTICCHRTTPPLLSEAGSAPSAALPVLSKYCDTFFSLPVTATPVFCPSQTLRPFATLLPLETHFVLCDSCLLLFESLSLNRSYTACGVLKFNFSHNYSAPVDSYGCYRRARVLQISPTMASSSAALPPLGWAHSTALHQLTWVPELAAPDYVDPYPANGVLLMADCWNTTASGFMEVRTSLRIIVGKDNSNQASNQQPCKWVGIYTITTTTVAPVYVAMSQVGYQVPAIVTQPVTHAKAEMPWTTSVQQHWPAIRNFDFVRPSREHALIPAQHRCFNGVRTRRDHPDLQTAAISYIAWTPDEDGTDDALENHPQSQGLDDESYRTWLCNISFMVSAIMTEVEGWAASVGSLVQGSSPDAIALTAADQDANACVTNTNVSRSYAVATSATMGTKKAIQPSAVYVLLIYQTPAKANTLDSVVDNNISIISTQFVDIDKYRYRGLDNRYYRYFLACLCNIQISRYVQQSSLLHESRGQLRERVLHLCLTTLLRQYIRYIYTSSARYICRRAEELICRYRYRYRYGLLSTTLTLELSTTMLNTLWVSGLSIFEMGGATTFDHPRLPMGVDTPHVVKDECQIRWRSPDFKYGEVEFARLTVYGFLRLSILSDCTMAHWDCYEERAPEGKASFGILLAKWVGSIYKRPGYFEFYHDELPPEPIKAGLGRPDLPLNSNWFYNGRYEKIYIE
ncbi:uncharacterized protein BDR25DRAFT_393470 [Lindgomyces ingoldianus]|uniref:Uncharacterized protein n=1 Tax=Lindgomyces ingoldianus TaxID=673940 RepID=A0ACB6QXQ7_9PLEO|nr:uncharacterized protein BDR25DRAFT_393470 [Lindgomyces ingoldianus]KAF2471353.1 hypothetical protein BDR25DRAFT_393470 [Lindgomyces ingoldianus]